MMPCFKFKKSRFFTFMASMFSAPSEPPPGPSTTLPTVPGYPAIPPFHPQRWQIDVWHKLVFAHLKDWTGESQEVWSYLTRYRLGNAYYYKTKAKKTHEYVICEFSVDTNDKIIVKFDRSASDSKDNSSISTFSSAESGTVNPEAPATSESLDVSGSPSSSSSFGKRIASSLSLSSVRSVSRGSRVSSTECLADDKITRLERLSPDDDLLKTITFTGDRDKHPHLWDLLALLLVVNEECPEYKLLNNQCFWFADTSFFILEEWATKHNCGTVVPDKCAARIGKAGKLVRAPIYSRDSTKMEAVWNKFEEKRHQMNQEREQFEQGRKDEDRRRDQQIEDMTKQLKEEREERERRSMELQEEREERERQSKQLQEERAERERQSKQLQEERAERERQSKQLQEEREEREERERESKRLKEEQEQLNQQVADMARRLQHEQEERERQKQETDRRIEELMQMMTKGSTHS